MTGITHMHEVVRHHMGKDHHILRNTHLESGHVEIIMFTRDDEPQELELVDD